MNNNEIVSSLQKLCYAQNASVSCMPGARPLVDLKTYFWSLVYRRGGCVSKPPPPPPKLQRPSKIVPNSTRLWKLLKISEFRMPTPQDVWEKGSKILKLPPVHNCFTLAMTHKLIVIINSLKLPKIKKILLYEMKFLVPNYNCQQNPWLGGYCLQIPVLSVLNWICCWTPPKQNSWVCHYFWFNGKL